MPFDPLAFATDLGLSDDDKTALAGLFGKYGDLTTKVDSLFDRQIQSRLDPLKADLETKQRELDAQFDTLASIRQGDEQAIATAEKRIETLASQQAALQERLRRVATEAGIDADAVLKDLHLESVKPEAKAVVESPQIDTTKILGEANRLAFIALSSAVFVEDLADEYRTLFGKPMPRGELISALQDKVKKTGNPNIGLRDVFDEKFNVSAKREEIREAEVQRRIETAVAAAKTAVLDEQALRVTQPGQIPAHPSSPIFTAIKSDEPRHVAGLDPAVVASIADYRARQSARKTA